MNVDAQIQAAQQRINKMIDASAREAIVIIEANAIKARERITRKINHVHFEAVVREKLPNAEFSYGDSGIKFAVL